MGIPERQDKLTFVSRDFVSLIKEMYKRRCFYNQSVFRLVENVHRLVSFNSVKPWRWTSKIEAGRLRTKRSLVQLRTYNIPNLEFVIGGDLLTQTIAFRCHQPQ